LTIEGSSTRIWLVNRSKVFVTVPFNFRSVCATFSPKSDGIPLIQDFQEPATLISIFAPLSFARVVDLGWDPLIERVLVDGKMCYDIVVHDEQDERVYHTFKVLSDVGAIGLRGQGTRVFLAHLLDEDSKPVGAQVALKDAWVDEIRPWEAAIRETLLKTANDNDCKVLETHLMTVLSSGDVLIDGKPDTTHQMLHRLSVPDAATFRLQPAASPPRKSYLGTGENSQWDYAFQRAEHSPHQTYPVKVHHREVFQEIGTPIDALPNLKDVCAVLMDIVKGQSLCFRLYGPLILRIKFFKLSTNTFKFIET
jgi:hypothetical protein